jgi:hypothetical protein
MGFGHWGSGKYYIAQGDTLALVEGSKNYIEGYKSEFTVNSIISVLPVLELLIIFGVYQYLHKFGILYYP